ncbi:unnamed protein product [Brugia timori]|uniref:ABC transporter permease n=1 Tax=Brugia timori TaxID=42155 RepID=A0A0R3QSF7_9BILA|nr:unnamed protein product [Brugia timori]
MIESVGSKFFKSITETADDLGGRFEIAFTNFSNKITGWLIGFTLFLIFITPVKVEIESATLKKQYDSLTTVLQLRATTSDGQFLSKFLKKMKCQNEDQLR